MLKYRDLIKADIWGAKKGNDYSVVAPQVDLFFAEMKGIARIGGTADEKGVTLWKAEDCGTISDCEKDRANLPAIL
jgi:hypothetical protein